MSEELIILEDQVLDHLVIPESAMLMWKERIDPELLIDTDGGVRNAVAFVFEFIEKHGEAPSAAIISTETGYSEFQEPEAPIEYVIEKLRERYKRRETKSVVKKLNRLSGDPEALVTYGFDEFARIKGETQSRKGTLDSWDLDNVMQRYETRKSLGPGVTFGFDSVDATLGGLHEEALYFVIGRPKRYKSWFLLKSATEALLADIPTVFFTLEMSEKEMLDRMTCMVAGVSWDRFTLRCLQDKEIKMVWEAAEILRAKESRLHFIHPAIGDRTVPAMLQTAKEYQGAKAIYIDQLSFIQPTQHYQGNQQWREIQVICQQLKEATGYLPVYVAAQFNREAANMNEMADLSKIGLSDAIGQTADMLLGLYANKDMKSNNIVQFGTIDSRSFGFARWDIKVNLTLNSNFVVANRSEE